MARSAVSAAACGDTPQEPTFLDTVLRSPGDEPERRAPVRTALPAGVVVAALLVAVAGLTMASAVTGSEVLPREPRSSGPAATRSARATVGSGGIRAQPNSSVEVASDVYGGLRFVIATERRPVAAAVTVQPAGPGPAAHRSIRVTHPRQRVEVHDLPGGPAVWTVRLGHARPVSGWVNVIGVPAAPPPTPWPPPAPPKKPSEPGHRHHRAGHR